MKITVGMWGAGISVLGLVVHLYWGDVYVRVPLVGELAWNGAGFFRNRILRGSKAPKQFRE